MTSELRTERAATFKLAPWLIIDIEVDNVGIGRKLFTFDIPGAPNLFVNLSVKLLGLTILYGYIQLV